MSGKICEICGEPSGMFPLCKKHLKLKKEGKVIKNDEDKWEEIKKEIIKPKTNIETKCIICGKEAPYGSLCKDCFYEMKEYKNQFDKNSKMYELTDYYYNLKDNIFRMQDIEKIKNNCKKLFAIATLADDLYENDTLINKIENDIRKIIEQKTKIQDSNIVDIKIQEKITKKDSQKEELLRTADGHKVKSRGEKIIDDILFNNRIPHAYGMTVAEIDTQIDRSIECDWFIPIIGCSKGIYIEYWGIDSKKDYNKNKEQKTLLYKKYNLPIIEIEKDEIDDSQALTTRIRKELNNLAKEKFKTITDY